jgi:hypothetical protein
LVRLVDRGNQTTLTSRIVRTPARGVDTSNLFDRPGASRVTTDIMQSPASISSSQRWHAVI